MRTLSTLLIAGLLVASAVSDATAQTSQRRQQGAVRTQPAPNGITDPYGERPYNPDIGIPCSERPFARDCDKRGFW